MHHLITEQKQNTYYHRNACMETQTAAGVNGTECPALLNAPVQFKVDDRDLRDTTLASNLSDMQSRYTACCVKNASKKQHRGKRGYC